MILLRRFAVLALCLGTLPGCILWKKTYVIPEMATAQEQYEVADASFRKAEGYVVDSSQRDDAIEESQTAFRAVIERFPQDSTYTPRASLLIGRCEMLRHDYKKASEYYRKTLEQYPDNKQIQMAGLYELGRALDGAKEFAAAKVAYKEMIDRFKDDQTPETQQMLREARTRYRAIRSE